jgi:hypothetical protein
MGLLRVVHMQTDLLHDLGDVRPCEGQVLESPCNALKLGSILNRRPRVCNELYLEVDRSRAWLTVSHGHMLDDACVRWWRNILSGGRSTVMPRKW